MSFVYAQKYKLCNESNENINIFCDTKIITKDNALSYFSAGELDLVKKYGIIKNTIICPEFCISFAGNEIRYAGKLFQALKDKHFFDRKYVLDVAYDIHINAKSKDDIEFIVSSYENEKVYIDCIKEEKMDLDCQLAHIGSLKAFETFQKYRYENNFDEPIFNKTQMAFKNVVEGCKDDSVGGFDICTYFDFEDKSFKYRNCISINSGKDQLVYPGENICFHNSAEEGGYTVEIVSKSIYDVVIFIEQMKSKIIYTRSYRNKNAASIGILEGFMLPMIGEEKDNKLYIKGV